MARWTDMTRRMLVTSVAARSPPFRSRSIATRPVDSSSGGARRHRMAIWNFRGSWRCGMLVKVMSWALLWMIPSFPLPRWRDRQSPAECHRHDCKTSFAGNPSPQGGLKGAILGSREVYFSETKGFSECPVYDRYRLGSASVLLGPAIVQER